MAGLNASTGMDLGLNGRVAIVAAASKGLGRAVAEELAREGTHVAICARTPDTVAETAAHIQKATSRDVGNSVRRTSANGDVCALAGKFFWHSAVACFDA